MLVPSLLSKILKVMYVFQKPYVKNRNVTYNYCEGDPSAIDHVSATTTAQLLQSLLH